MQDGLQRAEIVKFRTALFNWYRVNRRDLPWRRTRDPYAIWLSETMLQQTRVSAVIPYYERFLRLFPNVEVLASAPEPDVLAAWAGLGYYYRARNLQKAAQLIATNGAFPGTHEEIRALPGVGDYTGAAVASIAFGLPHAVVDGNVLRVLSRVLGDATDIGSAVGRRHFSRLAAHLLDKRDPSAFNQGLMELGATVCLPKNPQCLLCPVHEWCRARKQGKQSEFPVKADKQKSVDEERTLFWIERDGCVLAWQRPADSRLMPGFWELPEKSQLGQVSVREPVGSFRHGITFHRYVFQVVRVLEPDDTCDCQWISLNSCHELPISTVFRKALRTVRNPSPKRRVIQVD